MDKEFAKEMLDLWFEHQTPLDDGKHCLTTVQVHRTKGGTTHNLFLIATNYTDGGGTRIINATAQVANLLGLKFDPNSGGIPASASWVVVQQVQQLEQTLGLSINHEGA